MPGGCGVTRLGGADRYQTAAAIARRFVEMNGPAQSVILVSGVEFADALTAAPLARGNRPMLLTGPDQLPTPTSRWLQQHLDSITDVVIIGGAGSIAPTVANQVDQILSPPPPTSAPTSTIPAPSPSTTTTTTSTTTTTVPGPSPSAWATRAGGAGSTTGFGVSPLGDGSAIVIGPFDGTATFGTTTLTSAGSNDVFVARISATGEWLWAIRAGGSESDVAWGVSVSTDGSAIVTGWFRASATFGTTTLTSAGVADVFVAKVSASGQWLWAIGAGGTGSDIGYDVSVSTDGSATVTGLFRGSSTFGLTTLTSAGSDDVFVAKVSAAGEWLWATRAGGTGSDIGLGVSVSTDASAIVTGSFSDDATFGAMTLTSSGSTDVFAAAISAAGAWVWATRAGGSENEEGSSVSVLPDGSAIVTGWFRGTATFGGTTLTGIDSSRDVFVAKVDPAGTWLWATRAGGTDNEEGEGVAVGSDGSAIVTGWFFGEAIFGAATLTSAGSDDVFVGKVSAAGEWVSASRAGGTGSDQGWGMAVVPDSSAILTGPFAGTATFGTTTLTSAGSNDVFVAKISAAGSFG